MHRSSEFRAHIGLPHRAVRARIAQELESKDSLMLLGAGPKSNQPLIIRRGGSPYRGFLEGRTQGDKYALILHFSDLELKAPVETPAETEA